MSRVQSSGSYQLAIEPRAVHTAVEEGAAVLALSLGSRRSRRLAPSRL